MSHFPEVVFVLGLLLQITKIADLLLRPSQQDAIQRTFTRMAQQLDRIDPSGWVAFATSRRWVQLLFAVGLALVLARALPSYWRWFSGHTDSVGLGAAVAGATALLFIVSGAKTLQSLHGEPTVSFLITIVVWLVTSVVLSLIAVAAFAYVMSAPDDIIRFLLFLPIAISLSALSNYLCAIVLLGLVTLSLHVLKFGLSMLLRIVRGSVWRIVEYNKGTWAALTAIVTAAAGIAILFLQ